MGLQEILEDVVNKISFSKKEVGELKEISIKIISLLTKKGFKARLGGSLAKGTLIKGDDSIDIDIFVIFSNNEELNKFRKEISKIKFPGKIEIVHGSRDYYRIYLKENFYIELIPVIKNTKPEEAENVTDFSLLHVGYVLSKINEKPFLADEIKLAKSFCIANNFYGAESYIKGFSGYSLEVLVIYYGGFLNFLKGLSKDRYIDPEKKFKNKQEAIHEINSSKLSGPILLVDPTYKYRNVTAGLGNETFEKFLEVSKEFLRKPSENFFKKRSLNVEELVNFSKKKKSKFIEIEFYTGKEKGDIAGSKMRKFFDFFVSELLRKKQEVLKKEFVYSGEGKKARGYLVVKEKGEIEIKGPSVKMKEAVEKFRKSKGKRVFMKKGYWYYKEKISLKEIFEEVKRVESDMGAGGKILKIV